MNKGFPSMTALLGLLAVAGYQNRDKIAEMLRGATAGAGSGTNPPGQAGAQPGGLGDIFGNLGGMLGGAGAGSVLHDGLGELLDRFRQSGNGEAADSWVNTGPNQPLPPQTIEQAIGPDVLDTLSKQTGLSREELLARLTRDLPEAVNHFTPNGQLPDRI